MKTSLFVNIPRRVVSSGKAVGVIGTLLAVLFSTGCKTAGEQPATVNELDRLSTGYQRQLEIIQNDGTKIENKILQLMLQERHADDADKAAIKAQISGLQAEKERLDRVEQMTLVNKKGIDDMRKEIDRGRVEEERRRQLYEKYSKQLREIEDNYQSGGTAPSRG